MYRMYCVFVSVCTECTACLCVCMYRVHYVFMCLYVLNVLCVCVSVRTECTDCWYVYQYVENVLHVYVHV